MQPRSQNRDLARPNTSLQMTAARKADGTDESLPRFEKHLLCDSDGAFPGDFNWWETGGVTDELKREGTSRNTVVGWFMRPSCRFDPAVSSGGVICGAPADSQMEPRPIWTRSR